MKIDTLRHASIQEERAVDKKLRDDEVIRSRTHKRSYSTSNPKNKPWYDNDKYEYENKNHTKKTCNYCKQKNHDENNHWRKNPQLRNFQKEHTTQVHRENI